MAEGTKVSDHIDAFNLIVSELASLDEKVEDEKKALFLLTSLPKSFDHLSQTIMYGKTTLTYDEAVSTLLADESRKKIHAPVQAMPNASSSALTVTRNQFKGKSSHSSNKQKPKLKFRDMKDACWNCGKKGHMSRDCQSKPSSSKPTRNQANVVVDEEDVGYALCTGSLVGEASWILDSACSFHMCPNRDFFTTYESKSGNVFMGNDQSCRVVGIGTVRIQMFDGVIRTLTDVRHIPDLKRNLISLGALDSLGCRWSTAGGVLSVSQGSQMIMQGMKSGNLYLLQGTCVLGDVHATGEEQTRLWHARLGHMSEQGMEVLSKKNLLPGVKSCKVEFCRHCVLGKQHRVSFKPSEHTTKDVLDYIHSDVWESPDLFIFGK
jgi:hypothetical protein